jgi:hypothetical protein
MSEHVVEETMRAIRERVAERRGTEAGSRANELDVALSEARRLARISAHWGITPSWPVAGRIEVLAKRAMRIAARWYINPIVEQQNEFNLAVLGALYDVEAELGALRAVAKPELGTDVPLADS